MQQSILITGCSSGIGQTCAIMLKERGWRVFATARKKEDLAHLQSLGLEAIYLDVNDSASIAQALSDVLQKTGGVLDALFNNAGILQAGAIEDLSRDMIRAQFETNVFGSVDIIRQVLPVMRKQGHGRICKTVQFWDCRDSLLRRIQCFKFAIGVFNTLRQNCTVLHSRLRH